MLLTLRLESAQRGESTVCQTYQGAQNQVPHSYTGWKSEPTQGAEEQQHSLARDG